MWQPSRPSCRKGAPAKIVRERRRRVSTKASLGAIDEINERAPDAIEHVARFVLGPLKSLSNARLGIADDSAFVMRRDLLVGFDILHGRSREHPFRASDRSSIRSDKDAPDGLARSGMQGHNPDGFTVVIRAQGVARRLEMGSGFIRRMRSHGVGAA